MDALQATVSETQAREIVRLSEEFAAKLKENGMTVHELEGDQTENIVLSLIDSGVNVSWSDDISEADRLAILGERLPPTEVALRSGTRGHRDTWDLDLTYGADVKAKMIDDRISRLDPDSRGTMGNVALVLAMLRKDMKEASEAPEAKYEIDRRVPIFAPSTRDDGVTRIRTCNSTTDGKRITVEVGPGGIKLVPQYNPDFDPDLGRVEFGEPKAPISARTYIFVTPKSVADQIESRHDQVPMIPEGAPQS